MPASDLLNLQELSLLFRSGTDNSSAGERAMLEDLVHELNLKNGYVVDIAASDGYTQSCTLGLFGSEGWSGLAVEMDPSKFFKLAYLYSNFPNAKLARNKVTPHNIVDLLRAYEVPRDFDVLNLDIDSYDFHVLNAMLIGEFKPKVITMEINEKIPVGIYFTVDFDAKHVWEHDHFYGCSIDAASEMVKSFGYILWKVQYNNAVFIRGDFAPTYFKDQAPEEAYVQGYKNQLDRRNKFPWNSDVDYWLELPTKDAIDQLKKYFKKYEGKFTIRGSTPQDSRQTPSTYNQTSPENEYFKGD